MQLFSDVVATAVSRVPVIARHPQLAAALGTGLSCLGLLIAERDISTLPFVIFLAGAIASLTLVVSRRPGFALALTAMVLALSALASAAKFKFLAMNAHVIDVWFYIRGGDTALYLFDEFPWLICGALVALSIPVMALIVVYQREAPQDGLARSALATFMVTLFAVPATWPRETDNIAYHIRKNHFVSSFFVSFSDLPRLLSPDPLLKRLGARTASPLGLRGTNCVASNLPDIVLVLSESAVPPSFVPGWKFPPGLLGHFMSYDDRLHRAGVETHGGGTWISEASVMTGLSMADFGWMRSYPTLLMQGRVHNGLPATLAACGYETKLLSPASFNFIGNGPFMTSLGFSDYIDRRKLAAASQHEPDHWYFDQALDLIKEHRRNSDKPLFLYIETTTAHAPFDFRFEPQRLARGEPFGNDAQTDEYLRRLTFAQEDFAAFTDAIEALGPRPVLVAQFGDHHPFITREIFERAGKTSVDPNFTSPMYQTFYSVHPLHFEPASQLPEVPVLDLAFLGVTLLDMAGVPLDASAFERLALRDLCEGRFHSCSRRRFVDGYIGKLVSSGLLAAL